MAIPALKKSPATWPAPSSPHRTVANVSSRAGPALNVACLWYPSNRRASSRRSAMAAIHAKDDPGANLGKCACSFVDVHGYPVLE